LETLYKELEKNIMLLIIGMSESIIEPEYTATALPYRSPRLTPLSVTVINGEVVTLRASFPGITPIAFLWKDHYLDTNTFLIDII
jgi:hypothetical protein